ncbi:MAG: hypothetical protein A4E55_01933 [Pelotomaculum sp. PtaU1.Bin035]|nr:MAG: hypothetical protein A4E55_01933 [Pelotomaculum sp. PtaU1.Bin035]
MSLVKTNFPEEINNNFNHNRNWKKVRNFFTVLIAILIGYFILRNLAHFDALQFLKDMFLLKRFPELGKNASLGLLFVVGFLTSFHCIGMCGGIAISQSTACGTCFFDFVQWGKDYRLHRCWRDCGRNRSGSQFFRGVERICPHRRRVVYDHYGD